MTKVFKSHSNSDKQVISAFTLVELIVVIVVIGVLSTIGTISYASVQSNTRDSQRSSQASVISESLEKYYSANGEYPDCSLMTSASTNVAKTLSGLSPSALTAPGASSGTNSTICSEPTNVTSFGYVGGGTSYKLEYKSERTGSLVTITSRHSPILIPQPSVAPTVAISSSSTIISASITNASSLTCSTGTVQYASRHQLNDGTWSAYSNWSNDPLTATDSQTSTEGTKYSFQARAHCFATKASFSNDSLSNTPTYITPIATPATPTVTAYTSGSTTTWSWPAITCSTGSISYRYNYTTSSGYNSGWVSTSATALGFTTVTMGTYTVSVQAQCSNSYASSSWSGTGTASHVTASPCPTGYIYVPGSSTYGTNNFCVMRYEAKNVNGVATSQAAGLPWGGINQPDAITTSSAACSTCHLITEAEWMTIAQNVLGVASNWSGGAVGSGYIPRGNSQGTHDTYSAMDGTTDSTGVGKRTLTLSNGEVIWDLAGNVMEWTSGQITKAQLGTLYGAIYSEWTSVTVPSSMLVNPSPRGTGIAGASSWDSYNGMGKIDVDTYDTGTSYYSPLRGGPWYGSSENGLLWLYLTNAGPTHTDSYTGFRVSRQP